MRSHISSHSDSYTCRTIHKHIWNLSRQNFWHHFCAIVIFYIIYCFLFKICQQLLRDSRHPDFSVSLCGWPISIHGSEISLSIYQGISKRPPLSHSYNSFVSGAVSMRMIFTNNISNYSG